jgi:hypothetical protein
MEFKINLTLKQIYEVLCPKCRQKLLDVAARQASLGQLRENLKHQLESAASDNTSEVER